MDSASHVVNNKEKEVGGDKHPPTTPSVKGVGVGELRSLRFNLNAKLAMMKISHL